MKLATRARGSRAHGGAGLVSALMIFLGLPMAARGDTTREFWPELDLWVKLSKPARLLFTAAGTRNREDGDKTDATVAAYFDYGTSERVSLRAGYVYVRGLATEPGETDSIERRLVFDFNYRWRLSERAVLVDRTRLDLRDKADEDSWRLRNRLRLEYETKLRDVAVNPYASLEAYYDSRHDSVSRYRFEAGTVIPSGRHLEWDIYVGRQRDSQSTNRYANGIGLTLSFIY
ncbi:MAG TPA: DUF2490 domain-containing protein [Steroidobacteraceae bacterium]|nr:DUF2490 domain-containing protein [Steroidobacteraceae bacterium]